MKKELYNATQTNTLRLESPMRLKIQCRGEPEAIEIYHKRYYPAIENPLVEVVVPVLNEERTLKTNIETLYNFLRTQDGLQFRITIADNGSTDRTQVIANELAEHYAAIRVVRMSERGRGRALKQVWMGSDADILSYMDVDLSTSLDDFMPLIKPLVNGEAGVAIGSRLSKHSRTTRGLKRDFISKTYNKIIKTYMGTEFSDAQCGFKAIRRDVARTLLPKVTDTQWFFDTELLIKAEKSGVKIHEQPVTWIEDTDSRVKIMKTVTEDLRGLARVKKELKDINEDINEDIGVMRRDTGAMPRDLEKTKTASKARQAGFKSTREQKIAIGTLLILTAITYLFGALQNGMANSYYAAAVQAASSNFIAWLFGSLDAANFVSVDKPPLSTMIMGLSARIFGFSSFSMLLPNVLAGVLTVYLVYRITRYYFGFKPGIIAGGILAVTPVVALMSGFNNPDAILMCFLTASGYFLIRALDKKPIRNLALAALFSGLAFNTKMLQGLMVLPAIYVVYLCFAKAKLNKRILHLGIFTLVVVIASLSWSVLVYLTPAEMRPWVGSTNDNNIWSLIFGYNGFGRLLGNSPGNGGGGGGRTGFGGATEVFRMFNDEFGPNIAWFIPTAMIGAVTVFFKLRKKERTNIQFGITAFWLIWLLTHMFIFSMTSGTIHPYYVVVLAPAIAALVGISLPLIVQLYKNEKNIWLLPMTVIITALTAAMLLSMSGLTGLMWVIIGLGIISSLFLLLARSLPKVHQNSNQDKDLRQTILLKVGSVLSIITVLATPVYYTIATVTQSHVGSIPTAGPSSTALMGSNNENAEAENALVTFLLANSSGTTWIAAVNSANESAAIQISTGKPVASLGGFNGSDPVLTLAQFKEYVASGKIKYYVTSSRGMGGGPGGSSEIVSWIKQNATVVSYGGSQYTVYQLSA